MDYNATTSLEPEVIEAISEALRDAWGNPSSNYIAGEEHHLIKLALIGVSQLSLRVSPKVTWLHLSVQTILLH